MRILTALLVATAALPAAALGQTPITAAQRVVPAQLSAAERDAFRRGFRDVAAGRLAAAQAIAAAHPASLLTGALEAEIALARRKVPVDVLLAWLGRHADHPQAERIASLARAEGATELPALASARPMRVVAATARVTPRAERPDTPETLAFVQMLRPLVGASQPHEAERAWRDNGSRASQAVRTEWAQRIAWDYYQSNDNASAMRMGAAAGRGSGQWAALGNWVAGLAAWRSDDCERAARAFDAVRLADTDLLAAAHYWSSRAHMACGRPQQATARLRQAAAHSAGFYGLLARRALGISDGTDWQEPDFIKADWNTLSKLPGTRRAAALVEIGQLGLADRELKHLAATTDVTAFEPLLRLAARLNMPATQYWLAHRPPPGVQAPLAARFPAPEWRPYRGWRVEQALVYAHALQESHFVTSATSRVGARGVMQLMPGTARDIARSFGEVCDDERLADPEFNIEYGQAYLEQLRDSNWTQGLLPKVVAAYNAGPGSVQKWNTTLNDKGDPLLFIESIPFAETRHYVEVVLRNYWMYQKRAGRPAASIDAMVANLWPRFPGLPGATAVRMPAAPARAVASVDGASGAD